MKRHRFFVLLLVSSLGAGIGRVAAAPASVGVVSHVKVLSNSVPDVSSLEAWKASFIKPGMTDEQKLLAIWETVAKFRHQDIPPHEDLQWLADVHDPIKTFNVYGYGMCCCAASNVEALARYLGFEARGWSITAHDIPEVFYDDAWHTVDGSLVNYFRRPDGKIAGVDDIMGAVAEWYEQNPGYKGSNAKLDELMKSDGWMGYKKGPALLAACPFYRMGWWPAGTHGWSSTMQEYGGRKMPFNHDYSMGYQVNVQLRPGERLTRNWFNKGLHVNMEGGKAPGCLSKPADLDYQRKQFGDVAPGRVGNGTLDYTVPLADGSARKSLLVVTNLAWKADDRQSPAVHVKDAREPGVLELRMPSSYVYLGGVLRLQGAVGAGGQVGVYFSDNNGLDWKELAAIPSPGVKTIDLKPFVFRRYDYRLRFVLKGKGTGLDALRISHDIQHSQRPLPALVQGTNTITFSAGPQEGTVTLEGSVHLKNEGKQVLYTDYHPVLEGAGGEEIRIGDTGSGTATFPVSTPGEMTRLRIGGFYRARDARDQWDVSVSFDDGKEFKKVDTWAGPYVGMGKYVVFTDVPAGVRKALVRFKGEQRNTTCMQDLRIDADYKEPAGGFQPVRVTYEWEEGGLPKRDSHAARQSNETYTIQCAGTPVMKSISLELDGTVPAEAPLASPAGPITVDVVAPGRFTVEGKPLDLAGVAALAKERLAKDPAARAAVSVPAGISFAQVAPLLDALKDAGVREIGVKVGR